MMLPDKKFMEQMIDEDHRILKRVFRDEIRGTFLIAVKCLVTKMIGPAGILLYDFGDPEEKALIGSENCAEYEMCKLIVGAHHANTVFLTKEERSAKEKSDEYRQRLAGQVADSIRLRAYAASHFRSKPFSTGERYIYYPVAYLLFALCVRTGEILRQRTGEDGSDRYILLIVSKTLAALTLLEDGLFDSAYMPCRNAIETFVKLALFRMHPQLFETSRTFEGYELDKTCRSGRYGAEFIAAYARRKGKGTRPEFMHYGFVDGVGDYFNVVRHTPYSLNGIVRYLLQDADEETAGMLERLRSFYSMCHGYVHGSVVGAKYPLLHYFEISRILGEIVPRCFRMLCDDRGIDPVIGTPAGNVDVLGRFKAEFALMKGQYELRSTENFELEQSKWQTAGESGSRG